MTDIAEQFQEYRAQIQRILDKTARPDDKVPDADVREVLEVVKKIGKLGTRLRASVEAAREPEPEQADPLGAGQRMHAMALKFQAESGGKLTYAAALQRVCIENWPLVREYQQSVQVPHRRR